MEQDWDTLIVLDACRHDLFETVVDIDQFDEYRHVVSLGGATPKWTRRNFAEETFSDTVYVASDPYTSKIAPNSLTKSLRFGGMTST